MDELKTAMHALDDLSMTDDKIRDLMKMADTNKDDKISLSEFQN
jgi:hypothetical protein